MEILDQFGFDYRLFVAQIINFLIIAYILKRFAYKPLLETIKKRDATIKKGLADAEKSQKALEHAEIQKEEILKSAGIEADRIISEAKFEAQKVRDSLIADTKNEIEKMMLQTKEQIKLEKESFMKDAKDISLDIAKSVLQSTIINLFDKKDQKELLDKGIIKIKNEHTKN